MCVCGVGVGEGAIKFLYGDRYRRASKMAPFYRPWNISMGILFHPQIYESPKCSDHSVWKTNFLLLESENPLKLYTVWKLVYTCSVQFFLNRLYGPRQANLVLITYASSEGSGVPAHPRSLARTFAARSYKQWIKRNLQTESQIPGPSEWLGMRSWNLSWRNARRHKFASRGSYVAVLLKNGVYYAH